MCSQSNSLNIKYCCLAFRTSKEVLRPCSFVQVPHIHVPGPSPCIACSSPRSPCVACSKSPFRMCKRREQKKLGFSTVTYIHVRTGTLRDQEKKIVPGTYRQSKKKDRLKLLPSIDRTSEHLDEATTQARVEGLLACCCVFLPDEASSSHANNQRLDIFPEFESVKKPGEASVLTILERPQRRGLWSRHTSAH
jgi:hypothetical protein